jgi:Tol biopolymer transport system component
MRSVLVLCALCSACGRVGFEREPSDGGIGADAGQGDGSCTWGAFGAATPIAEVNTEDGEGGGTLSFDGLRLYFNRAADPGLHDLYVASRTSRTQPFGPAMPITELNAAENDAEISLSDDELTVYFHSARASPQTVYMANRSSLGDQFTNIRCALTGCPMFLGPTISADGSTLYGFAAGASGSTDIFRSGRGSLGGNFGAPVALTQLGESGVDAGYPGLSHDGRELYYVRYNNPGSRGCDDIWVATREDEAMPFGSAHALLEINTASCEGDPSLSADGTTLIFTSDRPGTAGREDLWMARRTCMIR